MRMEENIVDYLLDLLKTKGADIQYGNEDVTQLEHALPVSYTHLTLPTIYSV